MNGSIRAALNLFCCCDMKLNIVFHYFLNIYEQKLISSNCFCNCKFYVFISEALTNMSEHIFSSFAAWDAASVPFLQCKDGMLALITLPWKHKHTKRGWEIFLHVYSFNLEVLFQPAVYTSPRLRLFPQEIMNHENRGREWVKKKRENTGVVRMKERIKDNTNNIDNEQMKNKMSSGSWSTKDSANCPNCILCSFAAHYCHTRLSPGNDWQVGRCGAEQGLGRAALQLSQMCLWSLLRRPKTQQGVTASPRG